MATGQAEVNTNLRSLDEALVRHARNKDVTALIPAYYAPEAKLLPPNAPLVDGIEAIRSFWQGLIDAGLTDLTLETTTIDSSGDLAYGVGRYTFTIPSSSGDRTSDQGKYLVVFRRQGDGSWRAVADMFSSDQAAG